MLRTLSISRAACSPVRVQSHPPASGSFLTDAESLFVSGYSTTALAKKLEIREETRVVVVGAPKGYRALLEPLPP